MKAQTCPKCDGWKQVQDPAPAGTAINFQPCPVCNGTGYLLVPWYTDRLIYRPWATKWDRLDADA